MNPRTVLFIHQSFPGQFKLVARTMAAQGHKVYALALNPIEKMPEVTIIRYAPVRKQLDDKSPSVLREMDARLIRAESIYKCMKAMKKQGFEPDVIYAHPGWGEGLFVRNVWPKARFVIYAEWYYNLEGQEVNFDPGMPRLVEEQELRLTLKNTCFMHALADCDAAIAPTTWQKSRFPNWAQNMIQVLHDGLDLTELVSIKPRALGIPSLGLRLRHGMPIVTYAARNLEPVRGFHYFMRALPSILAENKEAHVIIMGHDAGISNVGYGSMNPKGTSWRKSMEAELGDSVDWSRVHFLGMIDRKLYLAMLKLSACHVYLTTPFILSWSFLEAAALGLPIVCSDTAPVREFGHLKGLDFVDFTDVEGIAKKVLDHLRNVHLNFYDVNAEALQALDQKHTIPAIVDVLLQGSKVSDMGGELQEVSFEDADESVEAVKIQEEVQEKEQEQKEAESEGEAPKPEKKRKARVSKKK